MLLDFLVKQHFYYWYQAYFFLPLYSSETVSFARPLARRAKCLFESMQLVGEELLILRRDCVDGITANVERCRYEAESSLALSIAL